MEKLRLLTLLYSFAKSNDSISKVTITSVRVGITWSISFFIARNADSIVFGSVCPVIPVGPVSPVGPVLPVDPVTPGGYIGGSVGPIEPGFNAAEDKNLSNIIHLWKIRVTNSKGNDRAKRNGQAIVYVEFNKIVILKRLLPQFLMWVVKWLPLFVV